MTARPVMGAVFPWEARRSEAGAVGAADATGSLPAIMGIVNVTPDSFSDGGCHVRSGSAIEHGLRLLAEGADILDIGGESTRPGAAPVSVSEEMDRVIPVIEGLSERTDCWLSIDTMKPGVAAAAVKAGAHIWNDVSALTYDSTSLAVAAELAVPVVLMHMQGRPDRMQEAPQYEDVVSEIIAFLNERIAAAMEAGLARRHLLVDPGIGFGKRLVHNLELMSALPRLGEETGCALVLGVSRKRFIHELDARAEAPSRRLGGSIAAALYGAQKGARVLRVHDVAQSLQALKIAQALSKT